jgi:hypothetical protein
MKKKAIVINGRGNAEYEGEGYFMRGNAETKQFANAAGYATDNLQGVSVMVALDSTDKALDAAIQWLQNYRAQM